MSLGHRTQKYTSPTYYSWTAMKNRCSSPTSKDWKNYGGRGIAIDSPWGSFENFLKDMGEKPAKGWSIERLDVNGNYCKANCIWATHETQSNNRKCTKMITYLGKTQSEAQWAREYGISRGRLHYRLSVGIPMEQALLLMLRPTGVASSKK